MLWYSVRIVNSLRKRKYADIAISYRLAGIAFVFRFDRPSKHD